MTPKTTTRTYATTDSFTPHIHAPTLNPPVKPSHFNFLTRYIPAVGGEFVPQMKDKNCLQPPFLPLFVPQSEDSGTGALIQQWRRESSDNRPDKGRGVSCVPSLLQRNLSFWAGRSDSGSGRDSAGYECFHHHAQARG